MLYDLVFEGGGAKGIAFLGAVQELEARGFEFGRLLGTSAGSISAAFLAAGFDTAELEPILAEKENGVPVFTRFMGEPDNFTPAEVEKGATARFLQALDLPLLPDLVEGAIDKVILQQMSQRHPYTHLFSFVERGGWFSADYFIAWLREKLNSGEHNGRPRRFGAMTLHQFYEATGRHLTIIGADTSGRRILALNHKTAPDCPLVWAVRMSMSVPLLWQEVVWQPEWGLYRGRDISGDRVVDGGLLSNFPIELLISDQPYVTDIMGPKETSFVLGLLIDENRPVAGLSQLETDVAAAAATAPPPSPRGIDLNTLETVGRLRALIDTVTQAHDKMVIDAFEHLVIRLPAQGYGTTEFDMSDAKRQLLIDAARTAVQTYLDTTGPTAMTLDDAWEEAAETAVGGSPQADKMALKMLQAN